MQRYLYRGVNPDLHKTNDGTLVPKAVGVLFKQGAYWDKAHWDDGSVFGESETNSVVPHQRDSSKNPTSGISTTPLLENACRYATHNGKYEVGYVYQIDTHLLDIYEVSKYIVADHATSPAIPGDEEVILVAKDFGALPHEIIVKVLEIKSHNPLLQPTPASGRG